MDVPWEHVKRLRKRSRLVPTVREAATSTATVPTKTAFIAQADEIVTRWQVQRELVRAKVNEARHAAMQQRSAINMVLLASAIMQGADAGQARFVEPLRALEPPAEDRETVERYIAALTTKPHSCASWPRQLAEAVRRHDLEAIRSLVQQLAVVDARARGLARGTASECAALRRRSGSPGQNSTRAPSRQ